MKNENNAKDFNEAVVENNVADVEVVEIQKKGLIEAFKALKTWQKVLVIFLLTGTVAVSVTVIYKLINNRPEAVKDAIETVAGTTAEAIVGNAVA